MLNGKVAEFYKLSSQIGGDVDTQVKEPSKLCQVTWCCYEEHCYQWSVILYSVLIVIIKFIFVIIIIIIIIIIIMLL